MRVYAPNTPNFYSKNNQSTIDANITVDLLCRGRTVNGSAKPTPLVNVFSLLGKFSVDGVRKNLVFNFPIDFNH
jgi:hypothetical protein